MFFIGLSPCSVNWGLFKQMHTGIENNQCCTSNSPKDRKSTSEPNLNGIYKMKGKVERNSDNVRNVGTFLFFITLDGLVFLAESLRASRTE